MKKQYTIGTRVPPGEILKRYKDEDGEFFLEVRDTGDVLFRVNSEDKVYYKIDKAKMEDEELTLIVDYTKIRGDHRNQTPIWEEDDWSPDWNAEIEEPAPPEPPPPEQQYPPPPVMFQDTHYDSADALTGERTATNLHSPEMMRKLESLRELPEGQAVPKLLRTLCKKNDYGYSLEYENYLYLLDRNYRVETKTLLSSVVYGVEEEGCAIEDEPLMLEPTAQIDPNEEMVIQFEKGDILPEDWRGDCEAELGPGGGSRLIRDDFLYILNSEYRVLQKMKLNYLDDEPTSKTPASNASRATAQAPNRTPALKRIPPERAVDNLVKIVEKALEKFNINADFFKESVLAPGNRATLLRAYHGDLGKLNDDTQAAAEQGQITVVGKDEIGFSLYKAALLHELYIKSTLTGRGDNMKHFVTYIIAAQPDGSIKPLQENISTEEQKAMMAFFKSRADIYTDKTQIILRIYPQVMKNIFHQYKELWLSKEDVRFSALLITRLYEHTTRLDRGNGITMIRLARDIIDYGKR